ncbi:MAG: hypothetical protein RL226_2198 [Bacteroidota bacterium]|jgi:uncharacterized protein (TIGR00159 family)
MIVPAFIKITTIDVLDILLVGLILYQLYRVAKGTVAVKIFFGILLIYLLWKLVSALQLKMLGEILGQFIGVGVIALMIVFQQELRQFLLFIGNRDFLRSRSGWLQRWFPSSDEPGYRYEIDELIKACKRMAQSRTGALIVLSRKSDVSGYIRSFRIVDAALSSTMLESIFFKNSPLHDGAVLISNYRIVSAGGILPVSENEDLPEGMGMRHRAALGLTEQTDALVIVISEENGSISLAREGRIERTDSEELRRLLDGNT